MNKWRDCSDMKSWLYGEDGKVVAELIHGGWDSWCVSVNSKARGRWVGRDMAKAAAERIADMERSGRIFLVQKAEPPTDSPAPTLWQRITGRR